MKTDKCPNCGSDYQPPEPCAMCATVESKLVKWIAWTKDGKEHDVFISSGLCLHKEIMDAVAAEIVKLGYKAKDLKDWEHGTE